MMGSKQRYFTPLLNVSLQELVPHDHFYRHLERSLDLSFVREFVQQTYAGIGRPSIDPVVFLKLQLVMFFEDIRYDTFCQEFSFLVTVHKLVKLVQNEKEPERKEETHAFTRIVAKSKIAVPTTSAFSNCQGNWFAASNQLKKKRLMKNIFLEKEGQKRTAVQKEQDRRRKGAADVLHFLLKGDLALKRTVSPT